MKKLLLFIFLLFSAVIAMAQLKVACVGNSITEGWGLKDKTYPAQLGQMLGNEWIVHNYGVSGRTLLSHGDYPYIKEKAYEEVKNFAPDVVLIKLGTNDAKPQNWKFKDEFVKDYTAMINELAALPSKPFIIVCLPVPAYKTNFNINDSIVNNEVTALVKIVAKQNHVQLIDLYHPLSNHPEWFPDNIHPNAGGTEEMAKVVSKKLLKWKKKIKKRKK